MPPKNFGILFKIHLQSLHNVIFVHVVLSFGADSQLLSLATKLEKPQISTPLRISARVKNKNNNVGLDPFYRVSPTTWRTKLYTENKRPRVTPASKEDKGLRGTGGVEE